MNEKQIYYSRSSVGKGKWFWAAYRHDDFFGGNDPFSHGFAETSEAAEIAAVKAIQEHYPASDYSQVQAYYAESAKRRLVAKKKAKRRSDGTSASQVEYVYRDWTSDYDGQWHSSPYRIVKKTKKRVYIDRDNNDWNYGDWRDFAYKRTFVLDRAELDREGSAWSHTVRDRYYTTPHEERRYRFIPECGTLLGLSSPWTTLEVKSAFRCLVKKAHPDSGGNNEDFKKLYQAYSQALAIAVDKMRVAS